jgi:hypothetical protein
MRNLRWKIKRTTQLNRRDQTANQRVKHHLRTKQEQNSNLPRQANEKQ